MLGLSLLVLAPSAFACPAVRQPTDHCCPTGPTPCSKQAPPVSVQRDVPCCAAQSVASQTVIGATPARGLNPLPAPFDPVIGAMPVLPAAEFLVDPPTFPNPAFARYDQQQIYLLTGRLRL